MTLIKTTRRTFIKGASLAAAAGVMSPYLITRAKAAGPLTVNTWGGSWTEAEAQAFYKPFTQATGIEIKTAVPISYAKLKVQVESGNYEWDVSSSGPMEIKRAALENLIEPLDWNIIDKSKLKVEVFENSLAWIALGVLITYRNDKFPNGGPQNWADFWDVQKFPGNRSMMDRSFTSLAFGALADGVPLDKVYPLDVDRALKSLDKIKKNVRVWWKAGNQSQQLIQDGEVDMIAMWSGRAWDSIDKNNLKATVVWNQAELFSSYWYVAKGTPRKTEAMKFIEFCTRAEPLANVCKLLPYGPVNPDSFQYLTEAEAKKMPTYPANAKQGFIPDSQWLAPNLGKINERWSQWLAS